jgi:ATP-dependent Clp protease ATP-binding subunit ClpA
MDAVRGHFRPEFLNRLDEQIIFDRLTRRGIVGHGRDRGIQLPGRLERRLAERKITLAEMILDEARCRGWPTRAMTRSSARGR